MRCAQVPAGARADIHHLSRARNQAGRVRIEETSEMPKGITQEPVSGAAGALVTADDKPRWRRFAIAVPK